MPKTIYIVTHGSYSDYRIDAVFDDKSLAQIFINKQTSVEPYPEDYDIEEWPINPHQKQLRAGLAFFEVFVAFDGETVEPDAQVPGGTVKESVKIIPNERFWSCTKPPTCTEKPAIRVHCWARDAEHALKIATDKRKELLATGVITND